MSCEGKGMNVKRLLNNLANKWNASLTEHNPEHGPHTFIFAKQNFLMLYYPDTKYATILITNPDTSDLETIFTQYVKPRRLKKFLSEWLFYAVLGHL